MSYYRNRRNKQRKKQLAIVFVLAAVLFIALLTIFSDDDTVVVKDGMIEIDRTSSFQIQKKSTQPNINPIKTLVVDKDKIPTPQKTNASKSTTIKQELPALELDLLVPVN